MHILRYIIVLLLLSLAVACTEREEVVLVVPRSADG